MPGALDTVRFKTLATLVVAATTAGICALLAHRALAYQRGAWGAGLYAGGDPGRAYPYLLRAAQSGLLARLDAAPLLDLGEVGTWGMDDSAFQKSHREVTPVEAARLSFVSFAGALQRRPTSSAALAGMADLFRRVGSLKILEGGARTPELADVLAGARAERAIERLVETAYRRAIEMEPSNYFWFAYLADFFVERGRREQALPLYARAIELMPDLAWHYYLGSSGPLPQDLFEAARTGLTRALATNAMIRPEKIESNLGHLYERQRNYDEALAHYRTAIELALDPSPYLYQTGVVLSLQGHDDEATKYFRRALERGTLGARQQQTALLSLGRILVRRGDAREAVDLFTRARALEPASYAVRLDLGRAYESIGEMEKAQTEYRQALSLDPAQPQAYASLIRIHRSQRDYARAIPLARRLSEMFPEDPNFKSQLDELYKEMGTERGIR